MSMMRAKMLVSEVTQTGYNQRVKLSAVYGGGTNREDNTYASATPSANLEMTIDNRQAWDLLKPGMKVYIDFTIAEEPPAPPA